MSRFFVIPDPQNTKISVCLMSFDNQDYVCRVSKDPIFFAAEPKLAKLLESKKSFVKAELERSESVDVFCKHLFDLLYKLRTTSEKTQPLMHSSYFRKVIEEIRSIGWENVSLIDPTLSFFEVTLNDEKGRKIEIRFDLPTNFPYSPPNVTSNLPAQVTFGWDSQVTKLCDIVSKYSNVIPSFDLLWTQLEDIDANTYVIDPRKPTLNCCMRLLYLNPQLWLQIEMKPLRPSWRPIIKFKGADQLKREMQQKYETNVSKWDQSKSIRVNIENILEMKLPKRAKEIEENNEIECPICFCERFGGELPEIVCENPQCAKHFHRTCLLDWLRENRKIERSFNIVYGTCPNCGAKIQCDMTI